MEGSILDSVGLELIGVMAPVSICMLLVVLLVYSLSPSSATTTTIVTAANLVYNETPTDSTAEKLKGALLNAGVFVLLIASVTFLLVVLYYYNFTAFLKHYMRLSAFFILATMGGSIFLSLITHFSIPLDAFSCLLSLLNFTVVGVISVFGSGVPILLTQSYTVVLGIVTAAWFTQLPEWTTWTLLIALALYDLVAVLAPGGPLKILVELSQSRDDDLPALVYEARPTISNGGSGERRSGSGSRSNSLGFLVGGVSDNVSNGGSGERSSRSRSGSNSLGFLVGGVSENSSNGGSGNGSGGERRSRSNSLGFLVGGVSDNGSVELQALASSSSNADIEDTGSGTRSREEEIVAETSPLVPNSRNREISRSETEIALVEEDSTRNSGVGEEDADEMAATTTRGIKLGLGDFVFYSVLVGRAALYDLMTVYACYLAIISGLGCTLILLSVCRRALPALPISIALGVVFYFLTRLLMEPFVVGVSTNLLMF